MIVSKKLHHGIRTLKSWMQKGTSVASYREWSALNGLAEYHAGASGFIQDAHKNMENCSKIGDMINNLPAEIRQILPAELKIEVSRQLALNEAWMDHAESFIFEEARIESTEGVFFPDEEKVQSLISRAAEQKVINKKIAVEKANVVVLFPMVN
jgi:hypothetical protein